MTVATVFYISVPIAKIPTQSTQPSQAVKEKLIMIVGRLGYNSENGRYGLLVSDLWEDMGFHCGECLEVMVDDKWVATRMEMSAGQEGIWLTHLTMAIWNMCGRGYKAGRRAEQTA